MPKAFRLTSGNRYSWTQRGVFMVNPDHRSFSFAGWGAMVHDIAHWAARRLYGEAHGSKECFIEYTLAKHVVSSGWLEGKLRRPEKEAPSKRDLQEARRQRVLANLQRWEAKRRRAERAIKKLRQKAKYYEKALAA
jgi:hypothetical protein